MTLSTSRRLSVLLVCATCAAAWAQTTQPAKRELAFEKGAPWVVESDVALMGPARPAGQPVLTPSGLSVPSAIPRAAACMGSLAVSRDLPANPQPSNAQIEMASQAADIPFSPEQRHMLKNVEAVVSNIPGAANAMTFGFFAASEEDARRMAEALLDSIDAQRRGWYDRIRGELEAAEKTIAEGPEQIASKKREKEDLEKSIEALKKVVVVPQWSDRGAGDYQIELQKLVRSINIEIAGIQAKQDAIRKLRSTAKDSLTLHLDQMQATQDVELAGAMVRKNMVEIDLKNTTDYSDATFKLGQLKDSIVQWENNLKSARGNLRLLQERLDQAKRLLEPVSLVGPITISPLVRPKPQTQPDRPPSTDGPRTSPVPPAPRAR